MVDELELTLPAAWAVRLVANDVSSAPDAGSVAYAPTASRRALRAIAYDAATRVLRIEWASGNTYELDDVPPETHAGLAAALSKGRYFQHHLRDRFRTRRIR